MEKELTELEKEFETLYNKHIVEINEQLKIATDAVSKARKLSEKYGIPFLTEVSFRKNSYFPSSFDDKKFGNLDGQFITDITDVCKDSAGWEHSLYCSY